MTTAQFLASEQGTRVVYSPETVARFDGIIRLDPNHALALAMTIWTGKVPSDKIKSQLRSTNMSLAYYLKDGSKVKPDCQAQREEWTRVGLDRIRCVRVHIALPNFSMNALVSRSCFR